MYFKHKILVDTDIYIILNEISDTNYRYKYFT